MMVQAADRGTRTTGGTVRPVRRTMIAATLAGALLAGSGALLAGVGGSLGTDGSGQQASVWAKDIGWNSAGSGHRPGDIGWNSAGSGPRPGDIGWDAPKRDAHHADIGWDAKRPAVRLGDIGWNGPGAEGSPAGPSHAAAGGAA